MGKQLRRISYYQWLTWVFGRPPHDPARAAESWLNWWDEERKPERTVELLSRLFRRPRGLLLRFSHAQINQGLNFLISPACSNHAFALMDPRVPWEDRERALRGIAVLYRDLFARTCTAHYGHLDRGPQRPDPTNGICYMWWDICPFGSHVSDEWERTLPVILDVLRETLDVPSVACQEGALHGLGHLWGDNPAQVEAIVDIYLARQDVTPELREYARCARQGCVL